MRLNGVACLLSALMVLSAGCKSTPAEDLPYKQVEGSVGFEVILESGPPNLQGPTQWLVTHTSGSRIARFRIELEGAKESSTKPVTIAFGRGRFVAVEGSDNIALIEQLADALEAKNAPTKAARVKSVPFEYAAIGKNLYRQADGGLSGDRRGNWSALKLFLRNGEAEVFLNLNPVLHKGEFSLKDPDYGDSLIAEMAKVL